MKTLSILGSTGSIGTQTLEIVRKFPNEFKITGLTTNKHIELLKKQIKEFKPEAVAVMDEEKADLLKADVPVYKGIDGLVKIAKLSEADTVVNSLVGSIGVLPTIKAIESHKNIALANKETLVTAGSIVMEKVKQHNISLMPIDSEHSAIWQCLNGEDKKTVNKITITCSGGAFKNKTKKELEKVTAKDALKHPTWDMGAKITIDCATLMNKGFEVIEAHWLYNLSYEKIDVILHPESIIHSLVEFNDHSTIAQLGIPSMKIPIQYALTFPKRFKNSELPQLELKKISQLNFKEISNELFPCLDYAYKAGKTGGSLPAVMNAANEIAVYAFLENKIKFLDIASLIKKKMDEHKVIKNPNLNEILSVDKKIKEETKKEIEE
ncbi:1-deoxy-D-xylulose-5-phosphate reductoisomerase [Candidatus Woesearchaeota archaeon]|nr:1-deoxy-D-xylulose-5-phosphate reductoisomerase [Candidatus Woesearchaeota archaeon]